MITKTIDEKYKKVVQPSKNYPDRTRRPASHQSHHDRASLLITDF